MRGNDKTIGKTRRGGRYGAATLLGALLASAMAAPAFAQNLLDELVVTDAFIGGQNMVGFYLDNRPTPVVDPHLIDVERIEVLRRVARQVWK
jgi:hypothetical protein